LRFLLNFLPAHDLGQLSLFLVCLEGIHLFGNDGSNKVTQFQVISSTIVDGWQFDMPICEQWALLADYFPLNSEFNGHGTSS
jgi:hypothetical protein